ncbi:hypothetical protein [Paraclostridium sordellii]|uniref:hypothetical protein n=1 Tax=Paraclostridium sordellii TaxID=1505 RepID=UPI0012D80D09|nr:hypothetical protein [Paeniclostridium sordellii]
MVEWEITPEYYILKYTVFFTKSKCDEKIIWNYKLFTIKEVINMCNIELMNIDVEVIKNKYSDQIFYSTLLTKGL